MLWDTPKIPKHEDTRIRVLFAWLPVKLNAGPFAGKTAWLTRILVKERYYANPGYGMEDAWRGWERISAELTYA